MNEKVKKSVIETKYLNVENTPRYRAIVRFLYIQFEQLKYWVQSDDIYEELKKDNYFNDYTREQCSQDLETLCNWGNLKSIQDTKNFKTIEEYMNKKFRYQPTEQTIIIERMLIKLENMEIETFSLEPTLIEKIANSIKEINFMSLEEIDKNFSWWDTLHQNFITLNQNYRDYTKELENIKAKNLLDITEFLIFKSSLTEYLRKFIKSLQKNSLLIESYLHSLDDEKVHKLFENIISYGLAIPRTKKINETLYRENIFNSWENIKEWFIGTGTKEAETIKISNLTTEIIRKITNYAFKISQTSNISQNRQSEYLKIATLFYRCEDINNAHKLSSCVFGIPTTFKLKFSLERKTDDINSSVFDEKPAIIKLTSKNKVRKERQNRTNIIDNTELKVETQKKLLKEIEKEKEILDSYIIDNKLIFSQLPVLDKNIRDKFLNWLFKAFENINYKYTTEYGRNYRVENINPKENCVLRAEDGDMFMPSFVLIFDIEK